MDLICQISPARRYRIFLARLIRLEFDGRHLLGLHGRNLLDFDGYNLPDLSDQILMGVTWQTEGRNLPDLSG